jgi:alkylation response protein AidB-like acyl-CoA dehydrogenase
VAASGRLPGVEGAASKLFATEAFQRSVNRLVDVAGPAGLVQAHDVSDLSAFSEYCYRFAPVTTIYGGTSEIQRNLIAQRGLGLPRGN